MEPDDGTVAGAWLRIEQWLEAHAPVTAASLRPCATPAAIEAIRQEVGPVPRDLLASLRRHDGAAPVIGQFFLDAWTPMAAARMVSQAQFLRELAASLFPGVALTDSDYWRRTWLPVAEPTFAGALWIDLADPGAGLRGWDPESGPFDAVVAPSWAALLEDGAARLEGPGDGTSWVPGVEPPGVLVWVDPGGRE